MRAHSSATMKAACSAWIVRPSCANPIFSVTNTNETSITFGSCWGRFGQMRTNGLPWLRGRETDGNESNYGANGAGIVAEPFEV